ncbi:hypothetical protein RB195_025603 [Necator americanus]|uniref:Uncharacterized protein n=1 Tax=Necator americanus TaxID=51031 RepID=A0ABR1ET15_NECAM
MSIDSSRERRSLAGLWDSERMDWLCGSSCFRSRRLSEELCSRMTRFGEDEEKMSISSSNQITHNLENRALK